MLYSIFVGFLLTLRRDMERTQKQKDCMLFLSAAFSLSPEEKKIIPYCASLPAIHLFA